MYNLKVDCLQQCNVSETQVDLLLFTDLRRHYCIFSHSMWCKHVLAGKQGKRILLALMGMASR